MFESVDLLVPGSPSLLLTDLAYFSTLAFLVEAQPAPVHAQPDTRILKSKPLTYIALCKRVMPLLAHLFSRFKASAEIYADGTVEAVLSVSVVALHSSFNSYMTLGVCYPNQTEV